MRTSICGQHPPTGDREGRTWFTEGVHSCVSNGIAALRFDDPVRGAGARRDPERQRAVGPLQRDPHRANVVIREAAARARGPTGLALLGGTPEMSFETKRRTGRATATTWDRRDAARHQRGLTTRVAFGRDARHTTFVSAKVVDKPSGDEFIAAAETLKLLADPTRLAIIWALSHGEHSVAELAAHVGVRPTAVSQHLAKLRLAGAVRTRRDGNRIFYAAENEHIELLASQAILQADHLVKGGRHHTKRQSA
jgi:DNA-binding transcriptional ArsR family regulator